MASIVSIADGGITGINFSGAAWRLQLKETKKRINQQTTNFYLSIVFTYPPADIQLLNFSLVSLIKSEVSVAEQEGEVQRVADVALAGGSLDKDKERTLEAFELFKNKPRVKTAALEADIVGANSILEVYWKIQEWISAGMKDEQEITELGTRLLLQP